MEVAGAAPLEKARAAGTSESTRWSGLAHAAVRQGILGVARGCRVGVEVLGRPDLRERFDAHSEIDVAACRAANDG